MTPERWHQVARLYETALAREPKERAAFIAAATSGDVELRREVEALLAQEQAPLVIDRSLGAVAGSVIEPPASLAPNEQLGAYRIDALLGAGGMGQVYRATDTRLNRTVAIKVLPRMLADDPQFRARFAREAQTIAALGHPHICTVHDVGHQDGIDFLVLEYLEGETLAARLERGALPFEHALTCAIQIAEALDAAHRRGIVHRDLKPGNIMLVRSGGASAPPTTKLLDFGLAKPATPAIAGVGPSHVPTTPPALTAQGTILGTFQYMVPEQLEGREADARTDIFAFGAVIYEMFTGKKAFEGKSHASLIGAIMHADPPPISLTQALTPPLLDHIVKKCLAKDPDERWQNARDVASELRWVSQLPPTSTQATRRSESDRSRKVREWLPWAIAIVMTLASTGLLVRSRFAASPIDQNTAVRSIILPPEGHTLDSNLPQRLAVSPDNRYLAFVARGADRELTLWLRAFDELVPRRVDDSLGAVNPFWSPDSRYVGFFAQGKLKTAAVSGGASVTVCDLPGRSDDADPYLAGGGGTWSTNGEILFNPRGGGLYRVPASGGPPTKLGDAGDRSGGFSWFLPDGVHFLYRTGGNEIAEILVGSINGGQPRPLLRAVSQARYVSGYLLYTRDRTLFAHPFDPVRLELSGQPVAVATQVETGRAGNSSFSAGPDVIAYMSDRDTSGLSTLAWIDRTGRQLGAFPERADYRTVSLSSNGTRAVVSAFAPAAANADLWLLDTVRGLTQRFTSSPNDDDATAAWSPDDERIAWGLMGNFDVRGVYERSSGVIGGPTRVIGDPNEGSYQVHSWSRDGRFMIYSVGPAVNLWILPLEGERKPIPFMQNASVGTLAQFSPNGDWIAYQSRASGRNEIYVAPFPGRPGKVTPVSNAGGGWPRWSRDGKELFYLDSDLAMTAVEVTEADGALRFGSPRRLFQTRVKLAPLGWPYDVAPDGRFLMNIESEAAAPAPIRLVVNWRSLLTQ